jgi:glyoxylase-like metal-dependent hydrolase (beta-lactamase superfamily II)
MLVRQTGKISSNVALISRGTQCNYGVISEKTLLIDTCPSFEVNALLKKLIEVEIDPKTLFGIALTHLHPEKVAGLIAIKERFPEIKIIATSKMEAILSSEEFLASLRNSDEIAAQTAGTESFLQDKSIAELRATLSPSMVIREGELLQLGKDCSIRIIAMPGHTDHSVAYLIQPNQVLVTDEGSGYFKLKGFTANGGDQSIEENLRSLKRIETLEISALALPHHGAITGNLIRRHLKTVQDYTAGMIAECREAFSLEMAEEEIFVGLRGAFYSDETLDNMSQLSITRSLDAIWSQIKNLKNQATLHQSEEPTN